MANRETVEITVGGHTMRLNATEEERPHIERAARRVSEEVMKLQASAGATASPAKIATMVAFQAAFDLSVADNLLDQASSLTEELERQKEAVKRLESLLSRVDDALAY